MLAIICDLQWKQGNEKLAILASHLILTDGRQDGEQRYAHNLFVTCQLCSIGHN